MKRFGQAASTAVVTLVIFATAFYTSCKKDRCANFYCNNSGVCTDGKCTCPAPFTGVHCDGLTTSFLVIRDHTRTALTVNVSSNDSETVIQPGASIVCSAPSSQQIAVNINTPGDVYINGNRVALQVGWTEAMNVPVSGYDTVDLNVPTTLYYLQVINTSAYTVATLQIDGSDYTVNIPNDGKVYAAGYHGAVANPLFQLQSPSKNWIFNNISLPDTLNQVVTLIAN